MLSSFVGDSKVVIDGLNDQAKHTDDFNANLFTHEMKAIEESWRSGFIKPRTKTSEFASHVRRHHNKAADALATCAIVSGSSIVCHKSWPTNIKFKFVELHFDGGCWKQVSGAGWTLQAADAIGADGKPLFETFVKVAAKFCDDGGSSTGAELFGACQCIRAALQFIRTGKIDFDDRCWVLNRYNRTIIDLVDLLL